MVMVWFFRFGLKMFCFGFVMIGSVNCVLGGSLCILLVSSMWLMIWCVFGLLFLCSRYIGDFGIYRCMMMLISVGSVVMVKI